jgi:hypothetical protein
VLGRLALARQGESLGNVIHMAKALLRKISRTYRLWRPSPKAAPLAFTPTSYRSPQVTSGNLSDMFIAGVVANRTFADVGGLWGIVNEKVSVAYRFGATQTTMIDVTTPDDEQWRQFRERMASLNVPGVESLSANILQFAVADSSPKFQVVHSSGVLYHIPDPIRYLIALRNITQEYLILSSVVTPTRMKSEAGSLDLPEAAVLFLPALDGQEKEIVAAHWRPIVGTTAIGVTSDEHDWRIDNFSPWWWLPTPRAMVAMCRVAGFKVLDGDYTWSGNAYTVLLAPCD